MALSRWEIKELLGWKGAQEVADRLGVHKSVVSQVISGKLKTRKVRVAIARKIGKRVDDVFESELADDSADSLEHAVGQ